MSLRGSGLLYEEAVRFIMNKYMPVSWRTDDDISYLVRDGKVVYGKW